MALVLNPRKLAAIDIVFLGARLIIAEYAIGVLVAPALGVLTLLRSSSSWQLALGIYLILLGINYELADKRQAMAKYRRQSVFLLVPLVVPVIALRQGGWAARH